MENLEAHHIQTPNTTNQLWKSSCINDTLMDLFYINLMHLLKNHHSSVQTDMNDTCTSDESLLLVPHSTASNTHTTNTTTTNNNNNTHNTATTNTNTTSNTTHTTNTRIPVSIPITDHKPVDCQHVNSSCSSLDPLFLKSHPLSNQHSVNVSFNVINLIDHRLNHHSDADHDQHQYDPDPDPDIDDHDDDYDGDVDDEGVVNNVGQTSKLVNSQQCYIQRVDDQKTDIDWDKSHNNELDIQLKLHSTKSTINQSLDQP